MNNWDANGIKRGRCKCEECPSYCFSTENFCSYCGCVPIKHVKLDDQSNAELSSTAVEKDNAAGGKIFETLEENDSASNELIPEPTEDNEKTPYSNLSIDVQQKLFSGLKGKIGGTHDRMVKALTNCIKNKKIRDPDPNSKTLASTKGKKISVKKSSNDDDNIDEICAEMSEEYSNLEKDVPKLKVLLAKTREARKRDSQIFSSKELLEKYPALNDKDLFIWEFEQMVEMSFQDMRINLRNSVPKLMKLLNNQPINQDENKQVTHLLQHLPELFDLHYAKKEKPKYQPLIEMNLRETVPEKSKAPMLIAADEEGLQFKCFVDSVPLHCTQPLEALLLLIATDRKSVV